ncbi:peroxiredoxin Q/BCP [Salana multivorans]|uniref:thioredoxin-dependent peroxiredoxin n=1 Tax=Salana multivorans TaxID=120377 RepID=A0A3N2DD21_9MICO|nr:thioredoxin-dependent thiol peroxidase [Salana multivorans]MBN8883558.1 thioredoxin-dependent thiol peroxidase [Salana multivorans]OJX98027.1 MAG: peroxiredoxin [Micrococcales bacterium 73-15]ROR97673.1 peroxiredoxin Q/BCP [Salana multivorans]
MATLTVGDVAPEFTLPTAGGDEVSLAELRTRAPKGVIVYFYPAAGTPGCTTQACDFKDSYASLERAGYTVVGISPDTIEKLDSFVEREGLPFIVASDPDKKVLEAYGAWGEKKLYGKLVVGVIRSTFVVEPDGTIGLAQYNVRATGHVAKLKRDLGLA